ncbi:hypothetical protein Pint_34232 [Pistacia integerrima]|uniref:Uncharacterized protein n=1 Tax=Pistacia integerrima TaxID=434235 RepID=A0ACC0X2I8_9ROSI|nr:hypothetical protein Pint_34232 [Pistacia integerrima]
MFTFNIPRRMITANDKPPSILALHPPTAKLSRFSPNNLSSHTTVMAPPFIGTQSGSINNSSEENYADVDWDNLGFGLTTTDYMYIMKCSMKENFSRGHLTNYGNIEISPSAGVLNYGQMVEFSSFGQNIMLYGCKPAQGRLRMPSPSVEQFVEAVPPHGKGSLYVRPLLMGSGSVLGIGPAPEYTFLIFASPIGNFYKRIPELIDRKRPPSCSGVYETVAEAKAKGFTDVLFLDAVSGKYIEEISSCNIFILKDNVISTPATHGTILPGVTRKSIIKLASDMGYQVEERNVPLEDLLNADEVFCTGTAMVVTPVASMTYKDTRVEYKTGNETVTHKLHVTLTGIQTGVIEDKLRWTLPIN